jgi:hypothetical protein
MLHYHSMFYNAFYLLIFSKNIKIKNNPMFYSNSNDDKNYAIELIILKTITK